MKGLGADDHTKTLSLSSNTLPDLTANPIPTGVPSNASWDTWAFEIDTQRPNATISWSSSMPKVEKCWSDIAEWRRASVNWWNHNYGGRTVSGPVTTLTTIRSINTTTAITSYPSSVSAYTLCDGSPRVDIDPVTKTTVSFYSTYTWSHASVANWSTTAPIWDVPQPCHPSPETCRLWYYHSNILEVSDNELLQQCGRPTNYNESCVIRGGPIELIYWPVPPKAELCDNNATGIFGLTAFASNATLQPAVPETITTLGHTFTSGTVYLSFATLYASWDGFWDHVGPDFSDLIVPLPSSSIFTQCGGARSARNHGTPLNYADLNWPVPASAYSCQARCDPVGEPICPGCEYTAVPTTGECGTIWSDVNPNLAMPTEIRELVPEWSTCLMYNDRIPNFWFDPPIALTKQTAIAVPTAHAEPTTEPAAPSSTLPSDMPVETGTDAVESKTVGPGIASETNDPNTSVPGKAEATTRVIATVDDGSTTGKPDDKVGTSDALGPSESPTRVDGGDPDIHTTVASSAPPPDTSTPEDLPKFTYDPTASLADPEETHGDNPALPDPTPSSSQNALSVLESALSQTNVPAPTLDPPGVDPTTSASLDALSVLQSALSQTSASKLSFNPPKSIGIDLGSESVFFPLPTRTTAADPTESQTQIEGKPSIITPSTGILLTASASDAILSIGTDGAAIIESSRTTYVSLPEATIDSLFSEALPLDPTSPTRSHTEATAISASSSGNQDPTSGSSSREGPVFSYSPTEPDLNPPTTNTKPQSPSQDATSQILLTAGSFTITAQAASSLSHATSVAGTTLSIGGDAVTLEQGEVISLGSDGLVIANSTATQLLGTVTSPGKPSTETEAPNGLPGVVQQPETTASVRSSTTTTNDGSTDEDATSTGAGTSDAGSDVSSDAGRYTCQHCLAFTAAMVMSTLITFAA